MTTLQHRLKEFFNGFKGLSIELESFPHPYSELLVKVRIADLVPVILRTRKTSRKGSVSLLEAKQIAKLCVLAEIAMTQLLIAEGYNAQWASEHETFKGPYDLTVTEGKEVFYIDVKCGDIGSTVTLTQSERDKIYGDMGVPADPNLADVHHVRADWLGTSITITNFYRVRDQKWSPGLANDKMLRRDCSYWIGQSFIND